MQNYVQPGETLNFTAPSGGVVSGGAYLIGALLVVAQTTVAATLSFPGLVKGVCILPKTTGTAWTEGELLYWDNSGFKAITTSSGNKLIGCAAKAAASGDATGSVYLPGVPGITN